MRHGSEMGGFCLQDLMSKIVKELPGDPVEFLISKLQILHRQRKKVHVATMVL